MLKLVLGKGKVWNEKDQKACWKIYSFVLRRTIYHFSHFYTILNHFGIWNIALYYWYCTYIYCMYIDGWLSEGWIWNGTMMKSMDYNSIGRTIMICSMIYLLWYCQVVLNVSRNFMTILSCKILWELGITSLCTDEPIWLGI